MLGDKQISVSVVLSNYNGAEFLEQTLESVFSQTKPVDEVLCVDDCSTDNSWEILESSRNSHGDRLRLLRHDVNQGQSAGFNTGIAASSGDLIFLIDSDDLWFPDKVSEVVNFFQKSENCAMIQHGLEILDNGNPTGNLYHSYFILGDLYQYWVNTGLKPDFSPTSGLVFPRKILDEIGRIPESIRICSDAYLTRAALILGNIHSLNKPLGYYRIHGRNNTAENISHNSKRYYLSEIKPKLESFYEKHGKALPDRESVKPFKDRIMDLSIRVVVKKLGFALRRVSRKLHV